MIGPQNEAPIIVNNMSTIELIDTGAQISTISISFCEQLGLKVQELQTMLKVEGTEGFLVPYLGYVGVELGIPTFPDYAEKVLMLVINDSQYLPAVPIQIGTGVINSIVRGTANQDMD